MGPVTTEVHETRVWFEYSCNDVLESHTKHSYTKHSWHGEVQQYFWDLAALIYSTNYSLSIVTVSRQ